MIHVARRMDPESIGHSPLTARSRDSAGIRVAVRPRDAICADRVIAVSLLDAILLIATLHRWTGPAAASGVVRIVLLRYSDAVVRVQTVRLSLHSHIAVPQARIRANLLQESATDLCRKAQGINEQKRVIPCVRVQVDVPTSEFNGILTHEPLEARMVVPSTEILQPGAVVLAARVVERVASRASAEEGRSERGVGVARRERAGGVGQRHDAAHRIREEMAGAA